MSLNDIVTNVAAEGGYTVGSGSDVVTSSDTTVRQLVTIAQRVTQEAFDEFPWWQFDKSFTFTLVNGQSSYPLPGDFSSYHFDTWWNQGTRWRVVGPMSPQTIGELEGFGSLPLVTPRFSLQGVSNNQIFISPTPGSDTAGQTIYFRYMSARPVRPWTWTANTGLGTRQYTFYNGNYYRLQSGATTGTTPPTHTSGSASDGSCTWDFFDGAYLKYLHGTDETVIPERLIEQGVLERFAVYKQMQVPQLFDNQLHEEYSMQMPGQTLYTSDVTSPMSYAWNGKVTFRGYTW